MAVCFTREVTITCDCGESSAYQVNSASRFAARCQSCKARSLFVEGKRDQWNEIVLPVADDFEATACFDGSYYHAWCNPSGRDLNRWLKRGTREQQTWPKPEPVPQPEPRAHRAPWFPIQEQAAAAETKTISSIADLALHQQQRFQAYEWKREGWEKEYLEAHADSLRRKLADLRKGPRADHDNKQIWLTKRELSDLKLFILYSQKLAEDDEEDCVSAFLTSDEMIKLDIAAIFEAAGHLRSAKRPLLASQRDYYGCPTMSGMF